MKVLILSSFVLAIYGLGCEENCDTCTDVHDIATISCDVAKTACTIANRDGYADTEEETAKVMKLLEDPPIVKITADECRQKCQEQADTEGTPDAPETPNKFCKYFRWEMGHEATAMKAAKPTTCSLQTTCPVSSDHCRTNCVSGQLGCNDKCEELTPCSLSTPTDWTHDKFHVICTDPNDVDGDVNIYSPEDITKIADGTICNTIRKCSEWVNEEPNLTPEDSPYYLKLAVECVKGTWTAREDAGSKTASDAMIGTGPIIEEQPCMAECLPLDLTDSKFGDQWWADLVCDQPLADGNMLVNSNSCILLCDNHLSKTIDCKYNEDVETAQGDKIWQDSHGTKLEAEDIKC